MALILLLLGCAERCVCPESFPVDLVFPEPGAVVPLTVVPVFGPESVGYVEGLGLYDGGGAEVPVAGRVQEISGTTLIVVEPLAALVAGETYSLRGTGADGSVEVTWFVADDVPVAAPTVTTLDGTLAATGDDCVGDLLQVEVEADAAWVRVEVAAHEDAFDNDVGWPFVAGTEGFERPSCRLPQMVGTEAWIRARGMAADGTAGEWSAPERVPWAGPP